MQEKTNSFIFVFPECEDQNHLVDFLEEKGVVDLTVLQNLQIILGKTTKKNASALRKSGKFLSIEEDGKPSVLQ